VDRADPRGGILSGFDEIPFHRYLGLRLVERRDGYARLRLTRTASTPTGIGGSVNGGVIATMIDMATIPAVFTGMPDDVQPAGTADLQVTYLRQAQGAWIDAEATVIKRGRQLCTVEVSVTNDAGQLCARGRVLYALRPGPAISGGPG
jgi:uncharacterized protein (TIGR00369 family)